MLIDSSHNVLIDMVFQYGVFVLYILMRFFYIHRNYILSTFGFSILLGILFLTLNVLVISHLLIIILMMVALRLQMQDNKKSR